MTKPLKIIFAGTPEFAVPSLQALHVAGHRLLAVYTQPDRPAGRGQQLKTSAVKEYAADALQLPVHQPVSLRDPTEQKIMAAYNADLMVVAAYGLILPPPILSLFPLGCLNIHASWLPRWRGAAPIQRAILAGDTETGISIMQMAEGLDTGDVFCLQGCPILATDTALSLQKKLAILGAEAIVETVNEIVAGTAIRTPQNAALAVYAEKLTKTESQIDWQGSALDIDRAIRAYNPWPIAYTNISLSADRLRLWRAQPLAAQSNRAPGTIIGLQEESVDIACGQGVLRVFEVQWPNKNRVSITQDLQAHREFWVEGRAI